LTVSQIKKDSELFSLNKIRGFLLMIFLFGQFGAGAELLLLEHYEDLWQMTPLMRSIKWR
jgi:hypothetical protein